MKEDAKNIALEGRFYMGSETKIYFTIFIFF